MSRLRVAGALAALSLVLTGDAKPEQVEPRPPRLTLEKAVTQAVAQHPWIRQAEQDVDVALANVRRAGSTRIPHVDAGGMAKAGLSGSANAFNLLGLASSPEPEGAASSLNVFHDVVDFRRTHFEVLARRSEVEYFRETVRALRARIVLEASRAFLDAMRSKASRALALTRVDEAALNARALTALYEADLAPKLDLDSANSRVEQAQLGLVEADGSMRKSIARLAAVTGLALDDTVLEQPRAAVADLDPLDELTARASMAHPEVAAVDAKIAAGEDWVERAKREKYPRIMLLFSGGWTRFAELTLSRLLFGGFGLQLPIFAGGAIKAGIDEAEAKLERTRAVREELMREVALRVAESHAEMGTARERIRVSESVAERVSARERAVQARYSNGLASGLKRAGARTAAAEAAFELDNARFDYSAASAELAFALGEGAD